MGDYLTRFSVRPYPCGGGDNAPFPCPAAAASSKPSRHHVHVRFTHHTVLGWTIDDSDDEIESRTICLTNYLLGDLLEEMSGYDSHSFIFFEGLCYWPIDKETVLKIGDEVVEKARRLRCDLQVDMRSLEKSGFEDDYFTFYSVRPYPTVGEDCADSSAPSRPHVHVRFSHRTADAFDDNVGYGEESRIVCLSDDLLAEGSNRLQHRWRGFIFWEGLCDWPINAGIALDIIDEVIDKAREYKCTIRVDMRTVHIPSFDDVQETYEDDRDLGEAVEGVNGAAAASDGGFQMKSLKRKGKRIDQEYGGSCCVICLEVLTAGIDVVGVMPCSHCSFHDDCLSSWLERSPSCPLCRRKMPPAAAASSATDSRS